VEASTTTGYFSTVLRLRARVIDLPAVRQAN
jgi:hypothetical protein